MHLQWITQNASDKEAVAIVLSIFALIAFPMLIVGIKEKNKNQILLGAVFTGLIVILSVVCVFRF